MEKEIWKTIEIAPNYEVSDLGRVRNVKTGRVLKPKNKKRGYKSVDLCMDGKIVKRNASVHRLVAQAFIPNPDNLPIINHKDKNPSNNCAFNLEWCTVKYNNYYSRVWEKAGRRKKPILQFTKDGEFVAEYESTMDVQRKTSIYSQNISACCLGKLKSAGGFIWRYK